MKNLIIKTWKALLFDPVFQEEVRYAPLIYVDIGASGALGSPWQELVECNTSCLGVVGFEPDIAECERLNNETGPECQFFPVALWNRPESISFNLCAALSMSSVHPPNHPFIQKYEKKNWDRRVTGRVITMQASTVDAVMAEHGLSPDVIKCDTQGSEYEILQGAVESLAKDVLAVVVETWSVRVHRGQRLSFDVERMMDECGFEPVIRQIHGSWRRLSAEGLRERSQETSYDILFLKKEEVIAENLPSKDKILKLAAVADVFGAVGYALDVLELAKARDVANCPIFEDAQNRIRERRSRKGRRLRDRLTGRTVSRFARKFGREWSDYAPLG